MLDAFNGLDGNGVAHAHAGAEVGVSEALGGAGLQQGADNGVGAGVPACGDDRNAAVFLGGFVQSAAQIPDLAVDVEAVSSGNPHGQGFQGELFHRTGGGGQNCHIRLYGKLRKGGLHFIAGKFPGLFAVRIAPDNADALHVAGCLNGFQNVTADIAITNNRCFNHEDSFFLKKYQPYYNLKCVSPSRNIEKCYHLLISAQFRVVPVDIHHGVIMGGGV